MSSIIIVAGLVLTLGAAEAIPAWQRGSQRTVWAIVLLTMVAVGIAVAAVVPSFTMPSIVRQLAWFFAPLAEPLNAYLGVTP